MVVDDTGRRDQENGWIVLMIFSRDQSCAPAMGELNEHRKWRIFIAKSSIFVPYSSTQCVRNIYKNKKNLMSNHQINLTVSPMPVSIFKTCLPIFDAPEIFRTAKNDLRDIYLNFYHYIIDKKHWKSPPYGPLSGFSWHFPENAGRESTHLPRLHGRFLPCATDHLRRQKVVSMECF